MWVIANTSQKYTENKAWLSLNTVLTAKFNHLQGLTERHGKTCSEFIYVRLQRVKIIGTYNLKKIVYWRIFYVVDCDRMLNCPAAWRVDFFGLLRRVSPAPLTVAPVIGGLRRLLPLQMELASLIDGHIRWCLRTKFPVKSYLHYILKFWFLKGEHMLITALETKFSIVSVWTPLVQDLETENVRFWNFFIWRTRIHLLFMSLLFS
jgi:hypothetical protein